MKTHPATRIMSRPAKLFDFAAKDNAIKNQGQSYRSFSRNCMGVNPLRVLQKARMFCTVENFNSSAISWSVCAVLHSKSRSRFMRFFDNHSCGVSLKTLRKFLINVG